MDKMKMESPNLTDRNIEKIAALFPNCITETADENGKLKKAINFEMLRAMLSEDVAEGDEAYEFTWVGKKSAIAEANKPIRKTLRPCPEESVNWDTTENLYIEGDNLEVLKLLQESYLSKVKMIYIDPPYNTGNDFIYRDDFAIDSDKYAEESGQLDEDGNRLFKNTDSNGRFHSDWCSMIYSRLMLARNLLADDGVIFISIDDNEVFNLKEMCDEVFGARCFIGNICRATGTTTAQGTDSLGKSFDYLLIYSKNEIFSVGGIDLDEKDVSRYSLEDEKGKFSILQLRRTGGEDRREDRPSMYYGIETPDGKTVYPKGPTGYDSRWRVGIDTYKKMLANNEIYFKKTDDGYGVYYKFYLEGRTKRPSNLWNDIEGNKKAQIDLKNLIPEKVFDTPKPIELITRSAKIAQVGEDDIILDFFSGSATTAHAVMQLNAEDGGHRKFIMVQLPEKTDESSEAYKAGYKNICEIGKERIRRAGKKIQEESPLTTAELDIGFRVFKLDDTNMEDVYYTPAELKQEDLQLAISNIKEDRTDLDLLFGCLLEWGLPLSMPYHSEQIDGVTVHTYNDGDLIACFDKNIPESVVKTIAKRQPLRVVFRDDSFEDSPSKINVSEIFKMISPDTRIKVI